MKTEAKIDLEAKFKEQFALTKDLHSCRAKGVMQEDIQEAIQKLYKVTHDENVSDCSGFGCSNENLYLNADSTIGIYTFYHSMGGIPSVIVGIQDKKTWLAMRKPLKAQALIR